MYHLSFSKDYGSHKDGGVLSLAYAIMDYALSKQEIEGYLQQTGIHFDEAFILWDDLDRIAISLDPQATPDSIADFIIRTWNFHVDDESPELCRIDWTFHILGETPDKSGRCSMINCSDSNDFLMFDNYGGLNGDVKNREQLARLKAAAHSGDDFWDQMKEKYGGDVFIESGASTSIHSRRVMRWYLSWFETLCDRPDLGNIDEPDDVLRVLAIARKCFKELEKKDSYFLDWELTDTIEEYIRKVISVRYIPRFQMLCDHPELVGVDEPDEEMRILTIVRKCYEELSFYIDCHAVTDIYGDQTITDAIGDYIRSFVKDRFRKEWYKNYCEELDVEKLDESGLLDVVAFTDHRLKVGHTERQDKFTQFMKDYSEDVLYYLCPAGTRFETSNKTTNEDNALPLFYFDLQEGYIYELIGCDLCSGWDSYFWSAVCEDGQLVTSIYYAKVLEKRVGIEFAALYVMKYCDSWDWWGEDDSKIEFALSLLKRASEACDNKDILSYLAIMSFTLDNEQEDLNLSIQMVSRLAQLWKKGRISKEWLTGDIDIIMSYGFTKEAYQEYGGPEEKDKKWLLMLLNTDFSSDIADFLMSYLQRVLEHKEDGGWDEGVQAIESFLERTRKDN